MLVKRLVQLQTCLDKADKPQVMFYFLEIKEAWLIWRHVNVKVLLTWRGFYNLDKTLDSEFYCLKCFVLKSFRNQAQFFNLLGFFAILCSLNGLQTVATVETVNFWILCFVKIATSFRQARSRQNYSLYTISQNKRWRSSAFPLPHQ